MKQNKQKMKQKTFYDLYDEAKRKPTAAQAFVRDIATATRRSENTVRMWLSGRQMPDDLAKAVIAKQFGVAETLLFPKREEAQAQ